MKYGHIIMMAMAVLMSTACSHSSEETTEQGGGVPVTDTRTAISFSGQQGEEQAVSRGTNRRAGTPLSDTGVDAFTVWGYKNMSYTEATASYGDLQTVFPGYIVNWTANSAATTTTNSNGWEYISSDPEQTIKYWDFNAKAYRYFGVTGTKWESGEWLAGQYKTNEISGVYEIALNTNATSAEAMNATPYFSHLWFSTGKYPDYADKQFGKPVQLEFLKPFARVRFLFKYAYPREGISLGSTKGFKPSDGTTKIARKGTVTVSYPLTGTATRESYTIAAQTGDGSGELEQFEVDYDPEDDGKEYPADAPGGWYTVLPVLTQGSYTLTANVNGQDRTAVVPAEYMTWLPGYSYTYIFKITEEGGVEIGWVEYAVTDWIDLEADWTVYNW